MFNDIPKLLLGLALLGPCSVLANVIHWEVQSKEDIPSYMGENFLLSGGFDFNSDTGTVSNITVKTSDTRGCIACNDFADGGTGMAISFFYYNDFELSEYGGVEFTQSYGPNVYSPGRNYWLQISGAGFDLSIPKTYSNMGMAHIGQILLYDPYDPDMFESVGCPECVIMTGTLAPIPEPETYALMLLGLGILGWHTRRRANFDANPKSDEK